MIPDDLLALFGCDRGPALGWAFAGLGAVLVVVPVVLLGCVGWELVRGERIMAPMTWLERMGERFGLYSLCPENGRMMWFHFFRVCPCDMRDQCRW